MPSNYSFRGTANMSQHDKALNKSASEVYKYEKKVQQTNKQLNQFNKTVNNTASSVSGMLNSFRSGNISSFLDSIKGMKNGFADATQGAKGLGLSITSIASVAAIASAAIGVVVAEAAKFYAEGTKVAMEFNAQLSKLQAITGKSADELKGLTKQALELGRNTSYTASQIVSLQLELAKLGFNTDSIKNMTESIQQFAKATGAELAPAASLAGATLRMFNMDSIESQRVADVLAKACSSSALSFEYLNSAMSTVGPVANAFGFSLEDTVALLGMLANAGFDASAAATATRNILLNLADSNGKLAQTLGHTVTNGTELLQALDELQKKGIDLATALDLTDKRSVAAFNTFLSGAESGKELITTLEQCDGAANEMAKTMGDNLQGDITSLKSAWEGLTLQLFSDQSILRDLVKGLTNIVRWVTNVTESIQNLYNGESKVASFFKGFSSAVLEAVTPMITFLKYFYTIKKLISGSSGSKMKGIEMTNDKDKEGTARLNRLMQQEINRNNNNQVRINTKTPKGGGRSGGRTTKNEKSPLERIKEKSNKVDYSNFYTSQANRAEKIEIPVEFKPKQTPEEIKAQLFGDTSNWGNELQGNIDKLFGEANKVQLRFDDGEIDVEEAQKMLDNISKMIGLDIPIKLDTSDMDKAKKDFNNIINASDSLAEAMGNIGSSFETPELEVGAIIAQAIAALVQQFATVPKGATVWDWIAGAAAGLVTLTATIASIKSATAGYASGGIIGGSTTIGDYNLARVNKGEMILNGSQQAHLFNAINNNRIGGEATQSTVTWKIQGSDLYGTLKNYGKTQSKLGKNIGIK